MNKAVFLDRDGVINKEIGDYITHKDHFEILPFVTKHLATLHKKGYKVIVITNQGGIAKGRYTPEELHEMHDSLMNEVLQAGGMIDEIYFCPHHPDYGNCLCRKPASLMVEKALAKYRINPAFSVFIGDKQRDIEAAAGAGVRGVLIEENQDWGFVLDELN